MDCVIVKHMKIETNFGQGVLDVGSNISGKVRKEIYKPPSLLKLWQRAVAIKGPLPLIFPHISLAYFVLTNC